MENIHLIFIELCTKEDIFPYLKGTNSYKNNIEKAYNFRIKSEIANEICVLFEKKHTYYFGRS